MLKNMGIYTIHSVQIKTSGKTKTDIDVLAAYGNVLIIVECCGKEKIGTKSKLAKSNFDWISKNLDKLPEIVKEQFKEFYKKTEDLWNKIEKGQSIIIRNILFTTRRLEEKQKLFEEHSKDNIHLMDFDDYSYFNQLSALTFSHAMYEFFIFLKLKPAEVGDKFSLKSPKVEGIIIEESKDKDIIVFKHNPDFLIKTTHVQRLYSWDKFGFQRLLEKSKINDLVEFLKEKKESFPNNIIVATHKDAIDYHPNYKDNVFTMRFRDFSYDIFVLIDGQHRLYAFASNDVKIKELSENVYLLVTAIIFKDIKEEDSYNKMAELFYVINTTYTKIDPKTSIDLQEKLWPDVPASKANKLLRRLNNEEGIFLFKKIEFSPYDEKYFGMKLLPRTTLIRYSGLKEFFKEGSKSYKIFQNAYSLLKLELDSNEEFLFWILMVYLKAIESCLKEVKGSAKAEQLLKDTELKKYYLMTVTVIGALLRLLRHFLSPNNPNKNVKKLLKVLDEKSIPLEQKEDKVKQIIKEVLRQVFSKVKFTKREWEKKGWKSSQWALVERQMIDIIREKYSNFGDKRLLKKLKS